MWQIPPKLGQWTCHVHALLWSLSLAMAATAFATNQPRLFRFGGKKSPCFIYLPIFYVPFFLGGGGVIIVFFTVKEKNKYIYTLYLYTPFGGRFCLMRLTG